MEAPHWFFREAIFAHGLTHVEALTYLCLRDHANARGHAWPSQRTIGREIRASRRSVQRSLERLELAGFITPISGEGERKVTVFSIASKMPQPIPISTLPSPTRRARFDDNANGWIAVPEEI